MGFPYKGASRLFFKTYDVVFADLWPPLQVEVQLDGYTTAAKDTATRAVDVPLASWKGRRASSPTS